MNGIKLDQAIIDELAESLPPVKENKASKGPRLPKRTKKKAKRKAQQAARRKNR